ncbi:glycosyltransferase [Flavobacterium psychrophilum]|nr:glycosyltransferase [Flavobacterium psychrophilum]
MKTSVALCTYNGEKYIKEQLDSILNQTKKVDEIIVCDDCSSDKTVEILNHYSSTNPGLFKIYINEQNLRSVKNFEKAITLCTGDIIFLSDQDDFWVNEKVEEYADYFALNPNIKVLASNGYCVNDNSQIEDKYALWDVPVFLKEIEVSYNYHDIINYVANLATGASIAFRKEIISNIVPFPIIKGFHHDEWIAIIASSNNEFTLLNKKYFYYRTHNSQQVGGVFYDKTKKNKLFLSQFFNLQDDNIPFYILKKRLSKIVSANHLNKKILKTHDKYQIMFQENSKNIAFIYSETRRKMKKKYPINSFLLNISDKLLSKRRF